MRHLSILLLLLITLAASGMHPPDRLWTKRYTFPGTSGTFFNDIELTPEGNYFITGVSRDFQNPDSTGHCAFLIDPDGDLIWEVDFTCLLMSGKDGIVLSDGSMVITGFCYADMESSRALFIMKIDQSGKPVWTKLYDYPDTKEEGNSIAALPDGGFAVCGRANGVGFSGQAWLLRTDSSGDTLWTTPWGPMGTDGKSIAFSNNELCMLGRGLTDSLPTWGPHLLFYDLDGNYLRGTDHPEYLWEYPASLCSTSDGGYTFVEEEYPVFCHTDSQGEVLWMNDDIYITPNEKHKGYCVRETMDGGYIFCGWDGWHYVPGKGYTDWEEGWLVRLDPEGNELWNINNYAGDHHSYYSCLQLPEGGYIACGAYGIFEDPPLLESKGTEGYLVRYAPETGISEPDPVSSLSLSVFPNPCSSLMSVTLSLPEAGNASIQVFDLSGRLVATMVDGEFPAGDSTVQWAAPESFSPGCYLLQLSGGTDSVTETVVLIR